MTRHDIDHLARVMALTRHQLAKDPHARRRAVCMYPLRVAQMANDMRRILDLVEQDGRSGTMAEEALDSLERRVRDAYRECFGAELGEHTEPSPHGSSGR